MFDILYFIRTQQTVMTYVHTETQEYMNIFT